ncbi:hypothetical protein CARUB_v10022053mg [Capsella rubella]|uniref:Uncharacterized protein n=1 Tax=Capsella rubella TaxID=81985 RepID=R0I8W3_9BRAS|nr:hypothetical protein CARUB_v10022053mg [Capsella rubella]
MQVLITTLILFLMTYSMAAIREEPSLIGVERKIPSGPDPIHNPPPKHHQVIGVERKIPSGPDPIHNPPPKHPHVFGVERKVPSAFTTISSFD